MVDKNKPNRYHKKKCQLYKKLKQDKVKKIEIGSGSILGTSFPLCRLLKRMGQGFLAI